MNQKRAWIYCRVDYSGANSAEPLEIQRHGLETYAQEHGLQITGFSSDTGNGLTLDRPGLKAFHAIVDSGQIDVLLLNNLNRLGEEADKVAAYLRFLQNHDVHVHTAASNEIDPCANEVLPDVPQRSGWRGHEGNP